MLRFHSLRLQNNKEMIDMYGQALLDLRSCNQTWLAGRFSTYPIKKKKNIKKTSIYSGVRWLLYIWKHPKVFVRQIQQSLRWSNWDVIQRPSGQGRSPAFNWGKFHWCLVIIAVTCSDPAFQAWSGFALQIPALHSISSRSHPVPAAKMI